MPYTVRRDVDVVGTPPRPGGDASSSGIGASLARRRICNRLRLLMLAVLLCSTFTSRRLPRATVTSPRDHLTSRLDLSLIGRVNSYQPISTAPAAVMNDNAAQPNSEDRFVLSIGDLSRSPRQPIVEVFTVRSLALSSAADNVQLPST